MCDPFLHKIPRGPDVPEPLIRRIYFFLLTFSLKVSRHKYLKCYFRKISTMKVSARRIQVFLYRFSTRMTQQVSAQVTQEKYNFSAKVQCVSFSSQNPEFFIYSFITKIQISFSTKTPDFVKYSFSTKLRYLC